MDIPRLLKLLNEEKVRGTLGGVPVFFADLDSLIKMKEAAGRPKDLEDLKYLRKLKKGK